MDYPSEANGWYIYGPHFTRFPIAPTHGGYAAAGREVELAAWKSEVGSGSGRNGSANYWFGGRNRSSNLWRSFCSKKLPQH